MAGLAMQLLLAASTPLVHQERALGARDVVHMTVVLNRWVSAGRSSGAVEPALGGVRPARLRRLEHRPATVAADLVEDGLGATCTRSAVAHLLAVMAAAFQRPPARADADVFGFDDGVTRLSVLPPAGGLPLCSLLLPWAATFATFVTAAAQIRLACPHAPRLLDVSLMTNRCGRRSPTSTRYLNLLHAESAIPSVALGFAEVTTRQDLITDLVAMGHRILARLPWSLQQAFKRRLSTRAVGDQVGRIGAVSRLLVLSMAGCRAAVRPAIELSLARIQAAERALEP